MSENQDSSNEQSLDNPTQAQEVSPSPSTESSEKMISQSEMGKVIAGVKKEFRQKGYNEGISQGYERANQKTSSSAPPEVSNKSSETEASSSAPDYYSLYQTIEAVQQQQKGIDVRQKALAKYDDFDEKLAPLIEKSQQDPDLATLLGKAASVGNEDIVYELISNPEARKAILEKNPRLWEKEILKVGRSDKAPVVIKDSFAPLKEVNAPSTTTNSERSWKERHARARARLKGNF